MFRFSFPSFTFWFPHFQFVKERIEFVFSCASSDHILTRSQQRMVINQENGLNETISYKYNTESGRYEQMKDKKTKFLLNRCNICSFLENTFLPKNHRVTVKKGYKLFAFLSMLSTIFQTAASIIAFESLFFSVAFGVDTSFLKAVAYWVAKDGLGQLGGVVAVSFINTKYDSRPRQWRFIGGFFIDFASVVETFTIFFPNLFLPIASFANVFKNIGWVSISASRAAIHKSFSKTENLADITGKAGSQSIFGSLIGTAMGIFLVPLLSHITEIDEPFQDEPSVVLLAVLGLTIFQNLLQWLSLKYVASPIFDLENLYLACSEALQFESSDSASSSLTMNPMFVHNLTGTNSGDTEAEFSIMNALLKSPESVASQTRIISPKTIFFGPRDKMTFHSNNIKVSLRVSPKLKYLKGMSKNFDVDENANFKIIANNENGDRCIYLLLFQDVETKDIIKGLLLCFLAFKLHVVKGTGFDQVVKRAEELLSTDIINGIIDTLSEKGWNLEEHFFEPRRRRFLSMQET